MPLSATVSYSKNRWRFSVPFATTTFETGRLSLHFSKSEYCRSRSQGFSDDSLVWLQLHQINVTAGFALPGALLSRVHHSVCALFGLMSDPVSWHHRDTLSSCCTALTASWVYETTICQCEYLPGSILVQISQVRGVYIVEDQRER